MNANALLPVRHRLGKIGLGLAACVGLLTAAHLALAADQEDITLVTKAANAGSEEVLASKLAASRAASPDVKAFADRMVKDHTVVGDELKTLAEKKGITVPASLPATEQAKLDKLGTLEGPKFDAVYATEVGVKAHKQAVALFQRGSTRAHDPEIKAFFAQHLPALQEHLRMAQALKAAK